jgi:acetate kinase
MASDLLLVLNAGSSTVKFAVYEDAPTLRPIVKDRMNADRRPSDGSTDGAAVIRRVLDIVRDHAVVERLTAVGHRIVHGGQRFTHPVLLDPQTLDDIHRLVPLAPLHQPVNLGLVAAARDVLPGVPQIACFDTAFHADQPRLARLYGLPRTFSDEGVIAYGFHGLSYAYIASVLRQRYGARAGDRVIVAHLGSGVSLCAMLEGRSIATTMGFSALDGPPMSTRCGSLDPGVVLYLIDQRRMSVDAVRDLLYEQSGWLGISGLSGDMTKLVESKEAASREAIDLFVYRVGREIGSLAAALGGIDRLVFTAGIGEHSPVVRARICEAAAWLGTVLDPSRNGRSETCISTNESRVEVLVIPTDEERMIAQGVREWRATQARGGA